MGSWEGVEGGDMVRGSWDGMEGGERVRGRKGKDQKFKLERSRQSARECRARKKLR